MDWVARASCAVGRAVTLAVLATGLLAVFGPVGAQAADAILKRGDAAVTGFSGARTEGQVPQDVHPLDRTFIDVTGKTLRIFDLSVLGTAPRGQLSDTPVKLEIKAGETGQVFGVALDGGAGAGNPPNLYVTATSLFGLQIVAPNGTGGVDRLLAGAPGAQWMAGQFGLDKGGTPGAIYKIDGKTGSVSLFSNVKLDGRDNAGPGLGNIAFDARTQQLFVSDLETGLIHRITLDGQERDVFDHGEDGRKAQGLDPVAYDASRRMDITSPSFNIEDSSTWGYADERRRVFGLGVSKGRLYYSVAEGPAVWSVSIDDEGDFGTDARIELEVANTPAGTTITDITFDGAGMMYLAQRGTPAGSYDYTTFATPAEAVVVRYRWDDKEGRWAGTPEEYAIGLAGEYRNATGGVALNYGYDKRGSIDFGKCRQTLWSTGEHLREGEDAVRVSSGGAKIVHGLQGNYKSRVRPDNEPPYETWFTDYDGKYEDPESYGQVGDVAIYAPCDGAPERTEAPLVTPEVIGEDPPVDDPGLVLEKRCTAGAIGGKIRCTISVRNVSDHLPLEDVKIIDVTKILAGPGSGTVIPIVSFAVPVPAILCAAAPATDFWCTIPAALLPPGDVIAIDVWVDTHDVALAGNLGFRNCAVLKHAEGYSKACAEGGTDIVVEKIGPAMCLPGAACKFGLKIANAGLMPYDGDVLLADAMFVGGAVAAAPVTSVNPPIACIAGDTNQLPFTCLTHLALAPGEEHIHWVEVTMPAPGGYWAENCFGALDPALMGPGPVPPVLVGGGGGGNPSCVWIEVPAPKENLKIAKTGVDDFGKCSKLGDDLICKYEIAITNENTAAFNDVLKIEEKVPAGASIISAGPVWGCAGGPPTYTCDTGGAVAIPAGGTVKIPVTVSIKVPDVEALGCSVPNSVKITAPAGGAAGNLNAADDTATATEWTWGLSWEDPVTHVTHVVCDPTNLKVTKKALGPCVEAGDGWECSYDVTITNAGPDPYKGPIKLDETFGTSPADVSFSAPFSCTGGGANYSCETPVVEMALGDSLTLKVNAKVADNGTCRLANTAHLTFPVAGSKGNGNGGDDTGTATANVPSKRCAPKDVTSVPPVTLIPLPRCSDGRLRRPNGTCPCPQGTAWNGETRSCENPTPRCYDDRRRKDDGSCCPRGTYYDDDSGRCRVPQPVCADPERRRDDGSCCPHGTIVSDTSGRCVRIEIACPPDTRWNYVTRECMPLRPLCERDERYDWRTRECRQVHEHCPWGTKFSRETGRCERLDIACPEGTHWNRIRHRCDRDEIGGTCPDGSPHLTNGSCRCPLNKRWNRKMQACERLTIDPAVPGGHGDDTCPPGSRRWRGDCIKPGDHGGDHPGNTCPPGTRRIHGECVKPGDTGEPSTPDCPKGQHKLGRVCVPDRPGTGPVVPLPCGAGKHRVGKLCLPDRNIPGVQVPGIKVPGTRVPRPMPDKPETCKAGQHLVGNLCMPDRVPTPPVRDVPPVKVIPNLPVKPVLPVDCPDGKHRVGRVCIPDRVIKPVKPAIEVPKVVPKVIRQRDTPPKSVDPVFKPKPPIFKPQVKKPQVVKPPVVKKATPPPIKIKPPKLENPGKPLNKVIRQKDGPNGNGLKKLLPNGGQKRN